jgi:hypothetical protein
MKKLYRILLVGSVFAAMLLSACGAAASSESSVGAVKGNASPVEFTGVIEAINGDQWTVNGQVITVDPAVVKDGPFQVGDKVKVEADVQADGSVVITRVETPEAPVANSTDDSLLTPEASATPDASAPGIVFDNSGNEAFGTVDSFDGTTIVIGGQTFTVANGAEIKDTIVAGSYVKVEFVQNADGTVSIREIKLWDPAAVNEDNSGSSGSSLDDSSDDQNDDNGVDDSSHDQNDDNSGSNSGSGSND